MKNRNRRKLLFAVLLLPLILSGCLKDTPNDQTIILFGEEGYVKSFEEVFGLQSLPGVDVDYDGIEPADVRGEFEFAVRQCVFPEDHPDPDDVVYFRFGGDFTHWSDYMHGQHHMITHCDVLIPGLDLNSSKFHADTAYVRGEGDRFVVYLQREQEVNAPYGDQVVRYQLKQGIAIVGNRAGGQENITNARLALYNKGIKILNENQLSAEVVHVVNSMEGKLFIYKDSDNVTLYNKSGQNGQAYQPYINWEE